MATIILTTDLSLRNDNEIVYSHLRLFGDIKQGDELDSEIEIIKKSIEKFKSIGIEIGLSYKYNKHNLV